ncbi:MAG: hypothetical protein GY716_19700 [bacterium]|nr:hypothetical protein [bacterium]
MTDSKRPLRDDEMDKVTGAGGSSEPLEVGRQVDPEGDKDDDREAWREDRALHPPRET